MTRLVLERFVPMRVASAQMNARKPARTRQRARGRRAAITRGILGLLLITAFGPPSGAQSRLGATDGRGPIAPPGFAAADRQFDRRAEYTAARLLETARSDRRQGRPEIAQRVLEILVARFPDTPTAQVARRDLFEIYASSGLYPVPPAGSSASIDAAPKQTQRSASSSDAAPNRPPAAPPSTWQITVSSARRLQDELRNSTGDRIFFEPGSTDPGSRGRAVLNAQAAWLLARPDVEAVIEGHADDAQAGVDNERIARERAVAARDRLVTEGIEPRRLRISAHGARDPVAVCQQSDCASQNRRVVVQVGVPRSQSNPKSGGSAPPGPAAGEVRR